MVLSTLPILTEAILAMSLTPQTSGSHEAYKVFYFRVKAVVSEGMIANELTSAVLALIVLLAILFMPFFFKLGQSGQMISICVFITSNISS